MIRAQVTSLGNRRAGVTQSPKDSANHAESRGAQAETDLAATLARRVAAIDPNDPDRRRKAFRVFLETVLLAEFGDVLMNDPRFHQLVEDVHRQMESEPDIASAIEDASRHLISA